MKTSTHGIAKPEPDGFDYGQLPSAIRRDLQQETMAIHSLIEQTIRNIVQIGLRLQLVRDQLGRSSFQNWLSSEFRWSQSVASNYMRVASVFQDVNCLERFQPSALYLLARKRTPDAARQEALRLASSGETITARRADCIVRNHTGCADAPPRAAIYQVRHYFRTLAQKLNPEQRLALVAELRQILAEFEDSPGER